MMNNIVESFDDILATNLTYYYFDSLIKLFLYLYLAKSLDTAKPFFCVILYL